MNTSNNRITESNDIVNDLFANNRRWVQKCLDTDINFFKRLSHRQHPRYFWIGCSDSRVVPNEITGLGPGEVFVHRNVANLTIDTDLNFLTALTYAINELKVEHIIVCGHYGCGGVRAVIDSTQNNLYEQWLMPIRKTYENNKSAIEKSGNDSAQFDALCEANVQAQLQALSKNRIVKDAWMHNQPITLHGWIYNIANGLLKAKYIIQKPKY